MRQTCNLCMSGWWWWWLWWSYFANKCARMSGWWWAQFHVGFANKLRWDMLACLGGGGLSFLQENPSKVFLDSLFEIPFS